MMRLRLALFGGESNAPSKSNFVYQIDLFDMLDYA